MARRLGALTVIGALACGVAACAALNRAPDILGTVRGNFVGGVAADEPRAAVVGRDILAQGGSVADAAVATYFAMAVTLPGTAGLGGGGSCLVHDPEEERQDALVFVPVNYLNLMRGGAAGGRGLAMVPGNPRGMFALHARYGKLRWEQIMQPAIELARDGHPMSRALARQLQSAPAVVRSDPAFMSIFGRNGRLLDEGEKLVQIELAATLSRFAAQDAGILYEGVMARQFVDAANSVGMAIGVGDLQSFVPEFLPTLRVELGIHDLHFAPPPGDGSTMMAQQVAYLADGRRYRDAPLLTRQHLLAEGQIAALGALQDWVRNLGTTPSPNALVDARGVRAMAARIDSNQHRTPAVDVSRSTMDLAHGSSGFVIVDASGAAVACSFSMNAPFGTGRVVPGTGIILGAPTADPGAMTSPAGVVMLINPVNNIFFFAGASGEGLGGVAALTQTLMYVFDDEMTLDAALRLPRLMAAYGRNDVLLHESWLDPDVVTGLANRGHRMTAVEGIGLVSAILCEGGLPRDANCEVSVDPRGAGLAMVRQSN